MPNTQERQSLWFLYVAALAALVAVALGVTATLWGCPVMLRFGGLILVAVVLVLGFKRSEEIQRPHSWVRGAEEPCTLYRWRLVSSVTIVVLFLVWVISCTIGIFGLPGLPTDEGLALFEPRPAYFVTKHGEEIPVSEREFRIIGTMAEVWWLLAHLLFIVVGLHWFYFGELPFSSSGSPRRESGRERPARSPDGGSYAWVGAAIFGAVYVGVLWLVYNRASAVNGVGLLERLGWPWSNIYLCVAAGAAVGIACIPLYRRYRQCYMRRRAEVSRSMSFSYQPQVSREDLGDFFYLRLFRKWESGSDRMTGRIDGLAVEVFDYTYREGKLCYRQTLVLLLAPEGGPPPFELRRRGFVDRALGTRPFDEGITFSQARGQSRMARKCIERFAYQYYLPTRYLSADIETWRRTPAAVRGQADDGLEPEPAGHEQDIRRLFTRDVLSYFGDHPGWCIESDGRHMAMWRAKTTIRAADRPGFVAEALEVYQLLTRVWSKNSNDGVGP